MFIVNQAKGPRMRESLLLPALHQPTTQAMGWRPDRTYPSRGERVSRASLCRVPCLVRFFRPFGSILRDCSYPRLAPWAIFFAPLRGGVVGYVLFGAAGTRVVGWHFFRASRL